MKQYGDIIRLSGHLLEPVDLIVGGSPCQDLSVAGKRAGLEGKRSGLFMEMIRIIKQMRKETNGAYPRFALWENVPGALSSGEPKGADFSAVLGEFARVIEPGAPDVPCPEEGWPKAGVLLVSNGSIAWRTHDAKYWGKTIRDSRTGDVLQMGTPQRRRRIALVADLRGQRAWEILFERSSLSGNPEKSETKREDLAGEFEESIRVYDPSVHHEFRELKDCSETVRSRYGTGGNNTPFVVSMQAIGVYKESDTASSLKQRDYKDATDKVCRIGEPFTESSFGGWTEGVGCSQASHTGDETLVCSKNEMQEQCRYVRKLTPLEAERLQGYPDRWTDIPGASDSKRMKALGNSIALPFWEWLAHRFVEMGEVKTIGSLFDGIGGFPLCFKRARAETKWTSEIEPFCEQVVKYHLDRGEL